MPQGTDALVAGLSRLTEPGARGRLVARGLARSYVWRDGRIPDGVPVPSAGLTTDLLDHGYNVLGQALRLLDRLRDGEGSPDPVDANVGESDAASTERDVKSDPDRTARRALVVAAESLEAAVRKGPRDDPSRDFHLVIAACAYHLARFAARAFCLAPDSAPEPSLFGAASDVEPSAPNLSTPERLLVALMRRRLRELRATCAHWLRDPAHSDTVVATRLSDEGDSFDLSDAEVVALTAAFVRATGSALTALEQGDPQAVARARALYTEGAEAAAARGYVSLWWAHTLARHLVDELWSDSLHVRLPATLPPDASTEEASRWTSLRARYLAVLRNGLQANLELWPSQLEAAARAVNPQDDLVAALPTSAGKTRIAELCMLRTLAQGRRIVYITPLRALSAQLERTLGRTFRPLGYRVTALYGASGVAQADVATLDDADIVVATPEKLDFALRVQPDVLDDVGLVVLDEGHMIGLGSRELRYEALVQRLLRRQDAGTRRIVCLSAIFSPGEAFDDFTAWIRSDAPGNPLREEWRPTRQRIGVITWRATHEYRAGRLDVSVDGETPYVPRFVPEEPPAGKRKLPFPKDDEELVIASAKRFVADGQRVLIYCPLRSSVEKLAAACIRLHRQGHLPTLLPETADIERALRIGEEWLGTEHVALRALRAGIAVHHGLLPRPFLTEIEDLLTKKSLSLVIASPTLAQGLDLSCGVLIFRSLHRGQPLISPAEFANVRGRAGRAYVDLDGLTVYPVFEQERRAHKVREFIRLVRDSETRDLESGLVLLAHRIADLLARALGVSAADLLSYAAEVGMVDGSDVSALASDWSDGPPTIELDWSDFNERLAALDVAGERAEDASEEAEADERNVPLTERLSRRLADLDAIVLSLVDDVECSTEDLAMALDGALIGSLWARRLARAGEAQQRLARGVVLARVHWVWKRTTPAQRRGYFAAGLGYDAGQYLDSHLEELITSLLTLEAAVRDGVLLLRRRSDPGPGESVDVMSVEDALMHERRGALDALATIASRLSAVEPFKFKHAGQATSGALHDSWPVVLKGWLLGAPVPLLCQTIPGPAENVNAAVAFIQEDVVYRLVWGVEAIRVHGIARGAPKADRLEGITALALTYGVPTRACALLAQSGLSSRSMALRLVRDFDGVFTTSDELVPWMVDVIHRLDQLGVGAYWASQDDVALWYEYVSRWQDSLDARWVERTEQVDVDWGPASEPGHVSQQQVAADAGPPAVGTELRVVLDRVAGQAYLCDETLHTVGRLRRPWSGAEEAIATVISNGLVEVRAFGPSAAGAAGAV